MLLGLIPANTVVSGNGLFPVLLLVLAVVRKFEGDPSRNACVEGRLGKGWTCRFYTDDESPLSGCQTKLGQQATPTKHGTGKSQYRRSVRRPTGEGRVLQQDAQ